MFAKVRFPKRAAAVALLLAGTVACGEDPVGPEDDPLAPLVGSWNASSFVYTSTADSELSVPILQVVPNSSVAVTVASDGGFEAAINLGPQTEGQAVHIPGTIVHEGNNRITVTFAPNPFFTAPLEVTYSFQTANTLSWQAPTNFDFAQNGSPLPATLRVVFLRD